MASARLDDVISELASEFFYYAPMCLACSYSQGVAILNGLRVIAQRCTLDIRWSCHDGNGGNKDKADELDVGEHGLTV